MKHATWLTGILAGLALLMFGLSGCGTDGAKGKANADLVAEGGGIVALGDTVRLNASASDADFVLWRPILKIEGEAENEYEAQNLEDCRKKTLCEWTPKEVGFFKIIITAQISGNGVGVEDSKDNASVTIEVVQKFEEGIKLNSGSDDSSETQSNPLEGRSWSSPTEIDGKDTDASEPQVANSASGDIVAAWKQKETPAGKVDIYASIYKASSKSWSTPTKINGTSNEDVVGIPAVAISPTGKAIVAWSQSAAGGGSPTINANYFDGTDWKSSLGGTVINKSVASGNSDSPKLSFSAANKVILIWRQNNTSLHSVTYDTGQTWDGANWTPPVQVVSANAGIDYDVAYVTPTEAVAVWLSAADVKAASYNGSAWNSATTIDKENNATSSLTVASSGTGQVLAVWKQDQATAPTRAIFSNLINGTTITDSTTVVAVAEATNAPTQPHVSFAADKATLVWVQENNIMLKDYSVSGGWDSSSTEVDSATGNASQPKVVAGALNTAVVVWKQAGDTKDDMWARPRLVGSWKDAQKIENDDTGDASHPQITIGGSDGKIFTFWKQEVAAKTNVYSATY